MNLGMLVVYVAGTAIAAFAILRALEIGRAFASKLYRSRAFWTAALLGIIIASNVFGDFPVLSSLAIYYLSIGEIAFVILILFIFVFVDRNLLTMKEIDFFHRDTFYWSRLRLGVLGAMLVLSAILLTVSILVNTNTPNIPTFVLLPLVAYLLFAAAALVYGGLALVVGAKRTPDRTMRSFSKLLGIALAFGVLSFTIWVIPVVGNFVASVCSLLATYALYLTVMSLSRVDKLDRGKIEAR